MIYHYKMKQPDIIYTNIGDGTKSNPWYWYSKIQNQNNNIAYINNQNFNDNQAYLRVKLNAGTQYSINEHFINGDAYLFFYDESGNYIAENDDGGNGSDSCIVYTPSTTGIYLIGASSYSGWYKGNIEITMNPAPESDTIPQPEIIYHTSTGFNNFGKAIKYRSASLADCNINRIPVNGLVFYAPLIDNSATAVTGQSLTMTGTVTYQTYKGIPCGYFNGNSDLHQNSFDNVLPVEYSDRTVSGWMYSISNGYKWILGWGDRGPNQNGGEILGLNNQYYPVYSQQPDVSDNSINVLNKWIHVCGVVSNNSRILYVNGIYKNSGNLTRGTSNNYGLYIGSSCGVEYFNGYLSSIRVYDRALTENEIISLSREFKIQE